MMSLIGMSLTRYKTDVRERMRRHKQAMIAMLLLMAPGLPALMALVLGPLAKVFSEQGSQSSALAAGGFALTCLAWTRLQRDLIEDGPAAAIMDSLPLSRLQLLVRDMVVMATASTPWILLLAVACVLSAIHKDVIPAMTLFAVVVIGTLGAQLAWIRRRIVWASTFVVSVVAISWLGKAAVSVVSLAWVGWMLVRLPNAVRPPAVDIRSPSRALFKGSDGAWFSLYCRALYHAKHEGYRGFTPLLIAMTLVAIAILYLNDMTASARIGLVVIFGGLASVMSSAGFATILGMHRDYASTLDTLPFNRSSRKALAVLAVSWPGCAASAILAAIAVTAGRDAWPALIAPLLCMVYGLAQLHVFSHMPRDVVVVNMLLACLSIGAGSWLMAATA